MNRSSSTRLRLAPMPPILISSSALDVVTSAVIGLLPALGVVPWGCRTQLRRGPQDGLHDVLVAGAAAQVARQRPPDVLLGGVRVAVKQALAGHHHARRAESALQAVLLPEPLLHRAQLPGRRQPLDGLHGPAIDL